MSRLGPLGGDDDDDSEHAHATAHSPGSAPLVTSRLASSSPRTDSFAAPLEDPTTEGRALTFLAHGASGGGAPVPSAATALLDRAYGIRASDRDRAADDHASAAHADRTARSLAAESFATGDDT